MGKLYTKDNIQIDTSIQPSTHPLFNYQTTQGLDYKLYFRNDSTRRYIPRRDISNEYIEIGVPEYLVGDVWKTLPLNSPNIDGNRLYFEQKDYTLEYLVTPYGVKTNLILDNPIFNKPIRWPISFHNLTKDGETLVSDIDNETVANFTPPYWYDSADKSGSINWSIENGYVAYDASDLTGATYPVTIDPTYGPTGIVALADDYYHSTAGHFEAGQAAVYFGRESASVIYHSSFRWDNIGIVTGSTITSASIDFRVNSAQDPGTTLLSKIAAVDENDAVAATSDATCDTDDGIRTTAQVDWDFTLVNTMNQLLTSADFSSVVQELADSGFIDTGEAILIHIFDDGSTSDYHYQSVISFDHGTYTEPLLTIVYTTPRSRLIITTEE